MKFGVTTTWKPPAEAEEKARTAAEKWGLPFCERNGSFSTLFVKTDWKGCLVFGDGLPFWHTATGIYRFHLGTVRLRVSARERGETDRLCKLLPVEKSCTVLDCTFGQGGDAMMMSWFLGARGSVTALEKSLPLYIVGQVGLSDFESGRDDIDDALRRITLIRDDFQDFLRRKADHSFDVVYFDAMFKNPVKREVNRREAFREAACHDALTVDALEEARRVARKKVIVKERVFSPLFRLPLFSEVHGKKGQSVAYGEIIQ